MSPEQSMQEPITSGCSCQHDGAHDIMSAEATQDHEETEEPIPALPDYVRSPNAVFKDEGVEWRYGQAPDYSKTRKVWEETKQMSHTPGSLEQIVENLVKNWEVEASFKPRVADWRTIDPEKYSFAMNGGPGSSAEHMAKVGTYNGIITPNEFYDPRHSDFASSHKTFKRMMPTFAWEVLEVYSGPPTVSFRWRHWGTMKNDYVGFNDKGEKVTAKAHGGGIDIQGVTIATVDEKLRLQSVHTWMDPLEMFRQIAPEGIVNKQPVGDKVETSTEEINVPGADGISIAKEHNQPDGQHLHEAAPEEVIPKHTSNITGQPADTFVPAPEADMKPEAPTVRHEASNVLPQATQSPAEKDVAPVAKTSSAEATSESAKSDLPSLEAQTAKAVHDSEASDSQSVHLDHSDVIGSAELAIGALPEAADSLREDHNAKSDLKETADEESTSMEGHPNKATEETNMTPQHIQTTDVPCLVIDDSSTHEATDVPASPSALSSANVVDALDTHLSRSADEVHPHPKAIEHEVGLNAGQAVAAPADSDETRMTHEEMSSMTPGECPFLMNRE